MFNEENWIKSSTIENTRIPYINRHIEDDLQYWVVGRGGKLTGHEVLEKALTLVGNYEFKRLHKEITGENSFKLLTKDDREIEIGFYYGGVDDPETFSIKEGNFKDIYEAIGRDSADDLFVNHYMTEELDTGFVQRYNKHYDSFSKPMGENTLSITIYHYNSDCTQDYYFIDENIKKEFKEKKFDNIMDVYNFIAGKYPSFEIRIYNKHWIELEEIEVCGNNVREIKLYRKVNNNVYSIREVFPAEIDKSIVDELSNDVETIHKTQKELKLK